MPTIEQNRSTWNTYDWSQRGDEWSSDWGGTESLWWGTLQPRIHSFVPADTILEIAPGFGRCTQYLKGLGRSLIAVDSSEKCIDGCRKRFAAAKNITFHLNDGKSLDMIREQSLDFVFSFDSLVHAESDVLDSYVTQLGRKLKPNGVGFIHHSNLGEYHNRVPLGEGMIWRAQTALKRSVTPGQRAGSMTAALFRKFCERAGLQCIGQELINWDDKAYLDVFSLFTPERSIWVRPTRILKNRNFMREVRYIAELGHLYASSSFETPRGDGGDNENS